MYNLTAEDLKYKWEALIFGKAKTILRFTRESAVDLKAEIQREIQAKNASTVSRSAAPTTFARGKLAGSAKFAGVTYTGLNGALKTTAQLPKALSGGWKGASVKLEQDLDSPIASSSRVAFVSPKGGRETRACEHYITPFPQSSWLIESSNKIGTCMKH